MYRFTQSHTRLVVLVSLVFLLTACGGKATPDANAISAAVEATLTAMPQIATSTAMPQIATSTAMPQITTGEPLDCLERTDSQQWLQDVKSLLNVWRDEAELVKQTSRITAAESSREMRNMRRQLRQLATPTCLVPVRNQLLYQMTGGLASLDAWIQESGNGWVFAAVAELRVDDFLGFAATDAALDERCWVGLDAKWVQATREQLLLWWVDASLFAGAKGKSFIDPAINDARSDCAKASVLRPILVWWTVLQAKHDALRKQGELSVRDVEDLGAVFGAIVEEYQEPYLDK